MRLNKKVPGLYIDAIACVEGTGRKSFPNVFKLYLREKKLGEDREWIILQFSQLFAQNGLWG